MASYEVAKWSENIGIMRKSTWQQRCWRSQ